MPKVSQDTLTQVLNALEQYKAEISGAPLADSTKATHVLHANNFVRWLQDDFEPGVNKRVSQTLLEYLRKEFPLNE